MPTPAPSTLRTADSPSGLWTSTGVLGIGRLVAAVATAAELVLAARFLDGVEFGRFTFLLVLVVVVESASDFGTGAAALQRGARDRATFDAAWRGARRARRVTVSFGSALLLAGAWFVGADPAWALLACLLPTSRLLETASLVFQRELTWGPIVATRVVGAVARAVVVPALLLGGVASAGPLFAAHAACLALANVLVHLAARSRRVLAASRGPALSLWSLAVPLGLASLSHQAALTIDNWILHAMRGEEELGRYNAAARVASFLLLFATNAGLVALPWLARRARDGALGAATDTLSKTLLLPAALLCGLLFPLATPLLGGLFGPAFRPAGDELRILLGSSLVVYATTGWLTALVASGDGRAVLRWTLLALLANAGANAALVPTLGGAGAAWATLGTEVLLSAGAWWTLRARGDAPATPLRLWLVAAALFGSAALVASLLSIP